MQLEDQNNKCRCNCNTRNAPKQVHLPQQSPSRLTSQISLVKDLAEPSSLGLIYGHDIFDDGVQCMSSYLTLRHGEELERIAHANRDQDGHSEQLRADLGKEEREWKGSDMGFAGLRMVLMTINVVM